VVTTRLPSAGFSITIRIAVTADASSIGRLTTCVGEAGAIVTALDVVDSDPTRGRRTWLRPAPERPGSRRMARAWAIRCRWSRTG
jgi:hypothetical protein